MDFGMILEGFGLDFWKDSEGQAMMRNPASKNQALMIRATRSRSIDR